MCRSSSGAGEDVVAVDLSPDSRQRWRADSGQDALVTNDTTKLDELIIGVLVDIEPRMQAAFDAVGGTPEPGSALDQVYLLNGREVITDYLAHGEPGLAYDHLLYMIKEPPLTIARATLCRLAQAGEALGVSPTEWEPILTDD